MSDSEPPADPAAPEEPRLDDFAYFKKIEQLFWDLSARATHVPPGDYLIARRWNELGVPLWLIERIVSEVVAKRRAQGNTDAIGFRYVRRWVERAWDRERALRAPAAPVPMPGLDVATRLARLADALPPALADREGWRRRIVSCGGDDPETVERALADLDRALMHAVEEAQHAEDRAALAKAMAQAAARLGARLPAAELARAEAALREQHLRDRYALPVLSLFAPEAEHPDRSGDDPEDAGG